MNLYKALVEGAERIGARFSSCGSCNRTHYRPCGGPYSCSIALVDTLQDIALEKGFDLKAIIAEAKER